MGERELTQARRKALEWVREDGVFLGLPGRGEPTIQMLTRLEREGLVFYGAPDRDGRGMRYGLEPAGERALRPTPPEED